MKHKLLTLLIISVLFFSCKQTNKAEAINKGIKSEKIEEQQNSEGYNLLRNNCYACHSVTAKSHDAIIAPPMVAIKRRYKVSYKTKSEFVEAMTNWVLDPKEEHALMRGAVSKFKVMPKQPFNKEEIIKIADYMFDNELEKPAWFESHFEDEHPDGMGNGKGRGKGMKNRN